MEIPVIPNDTKPQDLIRTINERFKRVKEVIARTMSGPTDADLDMKGHRIIVLGDPSTGQDALNLRSADVRYALKGSVIPPVVSAPPESSPATGAVAFSIYDVTITGATVITTEAPTMQNGQVLVVRITQDGTGSHTVTFDAAVFGTTITNIDPRATKTTEIVFISVSGKWTQITPALALGTGLAKTMFAGDASPAVDDLYNLGDSSHHWTALYATTILSSITTALQIATVGAQDIILRTNSTERYKITGAGAHTVTGAVTHVGAYGGDTQVRVDSTIASPDAAGAFFNSGTGGGVAGQGATFGGSFGRSSAGTLVLYLTDGASHTVEIHVGNGSPETVVTAVVGSLFFRANGGASTTLYVKESGSGNTGWIAK